MAEKHGFFDSTPTDIREYSSTDYAEYFKMFFNTGIANVDGKVGLKVSSNAMKVTIEPGFAVISGYYYKNTTNKDLTISAADTILNRIDRVVLKLDLTARTILTSVKKGTLSSTPVAPALQRDSVIYEISLCKVTINAKATSVTVTDERFDKSVCGQIEVAANVPLEQMWAAFNQGFGDIKSSWDTWFQGAQNQLGLKVLSGTTEPTDKKAGDIWLKVL